MSTYIIRATRQDDSAYMIWDTITDSPDWYFQNREELIDHLKEEARFRNPYWGEDGHMHIPDQVPPHVMSDLALKMQQLDQWGSTSRMSSGGWDCDHIRVMEAAPDFPNGYYWTLPRESLQNYILAGHAGDEAKAQSYLVLRPWD